MNVIKTAIKYIVLSVLLFPFIFFWFGMMLRIDLSFGLEFFYDDMARYNGDGRKPDGLIPMSSIIVSYFLSPVIVPAVLIYTAKKKYWWWFGSYMLFGGGFLLLFFIAYLNG